MQFATALHSIWGPILWEKFSNTTHPSTFCFVVLCSLASQEPDWKTWNVSPCFKVKITDSKRKPDFAKNWRVSTYKLGVLGLILGSSLVNSNKNLSTGNRTWLFWCPGHSNQTNLAEVRWDELVLLTSCTTFPQYNVFSFLLKNRRP